MVQCELCAHACMIAPGKSGICGVRENRGGILWLPWYGLLIANHRDPVEKKPLYHWYPKSFTWSIASPGCNFRCAFCQNFEISMIQGRRAEPNAPTSSPEEVVEAAVQAGCSSISYTYTEPTVFLEFSLDTAKVAKERGLKNLLITNGFFSPQALDACLPLIDAVNIDLKGDNAFYQKYCGGRLGPVLSSIEFFYKHKIWVEVTTLIIPEETDGIVFEELIKKFGSIAKDIPWHLSRFFPSYRMQKHAITSPESILSLREKARKEGFLYVYTGNMPEEGGEDTICPECGMLLISRHGYSVEIKGLEESICKGCGKKILGCFY